MNPASRAARWFATGVFMLSITLNFLDRQLLAAVAPTVKAEFHLSNTQYGELISAFYLVYAVAAPLAGLLVDRVGLRITAALAAVVWSLSGASTALGHTFRGLAASRMGLGLGESTGIPLLGKTIATWLDPAEMGISAGFGAISISLGSIVAPLVTAALAPRFGWRFVFAFSGALGLLWIPPWWFASRRAAPRPEIASAPRIRATHLLRDGRLWTLTVAYAIVYSMYMLWANWTTIYLVQERRLSLLEANARYAWLPPAFAILGGFLGGGLAFHWIRRGVIPLAARLRSCWVVAPLLVAGVLIPFLPSAMAAAVTIGAGFIAFQAILGNICVIPIDLFGARCAGFSNSMLGWVAAAMQVFFAPAIGALVDRVGFTVLCLAAPAVPLLGLVLLQLSLRRMPALATPAGRSPAPSR